MRYGVLGPLMVWDDEGAPVRVPEAKVRALLADLLVHEGRPVSTDRLVDDLWGEEPPGNPANALQAKVSQLRRVLGRNRVVYQPPGYRLSVDAEADEVDADRFRSLVAKARLAGDPTVRAALLTRALGLWRGSAYADFADAEFARTAARRLAEQRLAVVEEQAEARLESGEHTLLIGELTDLVARHPLRERLRAVQVRALYLAGRQSEALASYTDLRRLLADELGVDPGRELTTLYEAILRQDPTLTPTGGGASSSGRAASGAQAASRTGDSSGADTLTEADSRSGGGVASGAGPAPGAGPKAAASGAARSNLPAPLTALVGRDADVEEVGRLIGGARLVTLTGPGGVGKTRLAIEAAGRVHADLVDEVWLVELAGRHGETADLVQRVAAALGIRDDTPAGLPGLGAPEHPADRLAAALRDRRPLLVLDNCEHVVESAARLTEVLLHRVPGLRVLATSQEPLGLTGETLFLVEPLRPEDAAALFAARAAAAAPGFPLDAATPELRASVAEICRRLDGIPLALELAAARVRALGVPELAARLGDRFRVLTSGERGAPARQRTLRAVLDWSWELLGEPERVVLRRLAIHTDGCTLDAAEAVCAGDGVTRDEVLDLVGRLVDRSLVVMAPGPAGPRYRMLESVTAYALERLDEMADLADVQDRHLRHYLDLAERAEPHLRGAEQRAWLDRFDAEAGNLRAALDEAIRQAGAGRPEGAHAAVRLVRALAWWWLLRGRLVEGRRALVAVRAIAPTARAAGPAAAAAAETGVLHDAFALLTGDRPARTAFPDAAIEDTSRRGRLAWLYAYALFNGGDPVASARANTHALVLAARDEDRWSGAAGLGLRAMLALVGGDLADVARDGLRSAELFRELGDTWGESQTVAALATIAEIRGDYPEAVRRHTEGLRIARELRLPTEISARLSGLGRLALLAGDPERAHDLHRRALESAIEQGYVFGEVHARMGLALGARRSGDLDTAETHLVHMLDRYADVSSRAGIHLRRSELGFVAELRGDADAASAHHLLGLELAGVLGEPRAMALSLEGLAGAAALSGDADRAAFAALLLGAADAARRSVDAPLPPGERTDVDRITAATTATLGPRAFAEAYERGAALDPNTAAHIARTTPSPA